MVQNFDVDGNRFTFADDWTVFVYDEWSFYRRKLTAAPLNARGCDLVAVDGSTLYLIEAKDYTRPAGTTMPSVEDLADRVVTKAFHTMAGLASGAFNDGEQRETCRRALSCTTAVMTLSVEPPARANARLDRKSVV